MIILHVNINGAGIAISAIRLQMTVTPIRMGRALLQVVTLKHGFLLSFLLQYNHAAAALPSSASTWELTPSSVSLLPSPACAFVIVHTCKYVCIHHDAYTYNILAYNIYPGHNPVLHLHQPGA